MRFFAIVMAVTMVLIGISQPQIAGRLVVLLVVFATVIAATALCQAILARFHHSADPHPVFRTETVRAVYDVPPFIAEVDRFIRSARDTGRPEANGQIVETLRHAAASRLHDHHRLNLYDTAHQPHIRAIVSHDLWSAIDPTMRRDEPSAPLDALDGLLKEVKAL